LRVCEILNYQKRIVASGVSKERKVEAKVVQNIPKETKRQDVQTLCILSQRITYALKAVHEKL
jgi:hypothetical protein